MAIAQQLHKDVLILVPAWVFPYAVHQVEQAGDERVKANLN